MPGEGKRWELQRGCRLPLPALIFVPMEWHYSLDELPRVAAELRDALGGNAVLALHGPMGAGKTTLVSALCRALGIRDAVSSPTFSLVNEYRMPNGGAFFHIDLYRLRDEDEAEQAGIADAIDSGAYCVVEWPEKAPGLFSGSARHAWISVTGANRRSLKLEDAAGNP